LSALGFTQAVRTHCSKFSNNSHIPIEVEIDETLNDLPDVYGIILYRVLQETLTNIAKHAHASHVWVELGVDDDQIRLTVQDNGIGLADEKAVNHGIGIVGMKERVALVGGGLGIRSGKNGGTILEALLPLKAGTTRDRERS
jgi:two-component system sensor histidine kinase UhpB